MNYRACPPEWDVTPTEYTTWVARVEAYRDRRHSNAGVEEPVPGEAVMHVAGAAGNVAGWSLLGMWMATSPHPAVALMMLLIGAATTWGAWVATRHGLAVAASNRLAELPEGHSKVALSIGREQVNEAMKELPSRPDPAVRRESLRRLWADAQVQEAARKRKEAEAALKRAAEEKAAAISSAKAAKATAGKDAYQARIRALEEALRDKIVLDNPLPEEQSSSTAELLELATARHDRVAQAWGAVISDPLNALDHASLFDVSDARTAKFVTAYGELEDLRSIHREGIPDRLVDEYVTKTRECERLWEDAYAYSTKRGIDFLPAGERDLARKASRLLALAANESAPLPERAQAAERAAELLNKITAVTLPEASRMQISALTRLAITA